MTERTMVPRGTAESPAVPTPPEPTFVTHTAPSGLEVLYSWAPKRLYRIRQGNGNWKEVPSVTTVLGVLDKPALPWWGMKVGVEGVVELLKLGEAVATQEYGLLVNEGGFWVEATPENLVNRLNENKLTVNHVRDKAGDRGTNVHDALESWFEHGVLPSPEVYPESEQGYVRGLRTFLEAADPDGHHSEVMVGSLKHGFAGRYDLVASIDEVDLVTKHYPKRADRVEKVHSGRYSLDLKTSAGVYPSHFFQLEAYEEASKECGYEPTDYRAVIHVFPDGAYELVASTAKFSDFKAILGAYKALERQKGGKR